MHNFMYYLFLTVAATSVLAIPISVEEAQVYMA